MVVLSAGYPTRFRSAFQPHASWTFPTFLEGDGWCPSGKGGGAENPGPVRSGRPRVRLAGAARSAACRRPSLASPRDPLRACIPSARTPVFSAPSQETAIPLRGLAADFSREGLATRLRGLRLRGVRAEAACAAGADAGRCGPARRLLSSAPHAGPHRLRAASRIATPSPCSPRAHARCALSLAPSGRSCTALVRRRTPGRRPCAAAHTGRREDEARPEGERRSDGRGMRGGMRREREAGRAKAASKRAAGRPASHRAAPAARPRPKAESTVLPAGRQDSQRGGLERRGCGGGKARRGRIIKRGFLSMH